VDVDKQVDQVGAAVTKELVTFGTVVVGPALRPADVEEVVVVDTPKLAPLLVMVVSTTS
jgi:hypothetical protein